MADPIKCQMCGKPATVHLTQIANNKIHKVDLCEQCAQEKGVTDPGGFSLVDMLTKSNIESGMDTDAIVCPQCGFSDVDFKKTGRLGCPGCYDAFKVHLKPVLRAMHPGLRHAGKIPERTYQEIFIKNRIQDLEKKMASAVETECYEEAAEFRDELKQLRQDLSVNSSC